MKRLAIDGTLRETAKFIARIATIEGDRLKLGSVERLFLRYLAEELELRVGSQRVTAEMLGRSLRTFQRAAQFEPSEDLFSLRQDILDTLRENRSSRTEILASFPMHPFEDITAALNDLINSQLVALSGDKFVVNDGETKTETVDPLLAQALFISTRVHRPTELTKLVDRFETYPDIERVIDYAVKLGFLQFDSKTDLVEPVGGEITKSEGIAALITMHFAYAFNAISQKLELIEQGYPDAIVTGTIGGYSVWPSHPLVTDVLEFFRYVSDKSRELYFDVKQSEQPEDEKSTTLLFHFGFSVKE